VNRPHAHRATTGKEAEQHGSRPRPRGVRRPGMSWRGPDKAEKAAGVEGRQGRIHCGGRSEQRTRGKRSRSQAGRRGWSAGRGSPWCEMQGQREDRAQRSECRPVDPAGQARSSKPRPADRPASTNHRTSGAARNGVPLRRRCERGAGRSSARKRQGRAKKRVGVGEGADERADTDRRDEPTARKKSRRAGAANRAPSPANRAADGGARLRPREAGGDRVVGTLPKQRGSTLGQRHGATP